MEDYKKQFHIRYVILKFTVRMVRDCTLPAEKASAIRGGFGNCLLDLQCISSIKPEPCEDCTFRQACIVQNIMYAPLKIPVAFVNGKESEGYSISCLDKRTNFYQGETFSFSITLFGDVIVYLQPILQAFFRLGTYGIGKEKAQFEIIEIKNQLGQNLFEDGNVCLNHYYFQYIEDYIFYRIKKLQEGRYQRQEIRSREEVENVTWNLKVNMFTPLALKYHGILLKEFHFGALINALSRRIYVMNCFEGQKTFQKKWNDGTSWESFRNGKMTEEEKSQKEGETKYLPEMRVEWNFGKNVKRYSGTQKKKISMSGITGEFLLYGVTTEILWYLLAGEILQVGKHISFGFGKYHIEEIVS